MKSKIYKLIISILNVLPFKKRIFRLLKLIFKDTSKFSQDLNFIGAFKIQWHSKNVSFYNYGGSIENSIFWNELDEYEKEANWAWNTLAKSSNIIFDIGANTGVYSVMSKVVNPSAKVFAFEPSINTFKKLKKNIELNKMDVVCEQIAVSDSDKIETFYDVPDEHQKSASLSPEKLKNWGGYKGEIIEYDMQCSTLDSYISKNNITSIDLMKIDVEMHEPEALKGFKKHLDLFKPIMMIEVLTQDIANQLKPLLPNDTYRIIHLSGPRNSKLIKDFIIDYDHYNFLVYHKDNDEKILELIDNFADFNPFN